MRFKILAISGALIIGVLGATAVALAGWCWGDPTVGITAPGQAERDISIDVAVPDEFVQDVDEVPIKVRVPENVTARVKFQDNILPEVVTLKRDLDKWHRGDDIDVVVSVEVESAEDFPVMWTVTWTEPDGSERVLTRYGESDHKGSVSFKLRDD